MQYNRFLSSRNFTQNQVIPILDELIQKARKGEKQEWLKVKNQIEGCGQFTYWVECQNCGTREFQGFTSCRSRYCVACARKKALLWLARVLPVIQDHRAAGGNITMLTFTLRDQELLGPMTEQLQTSWRKFYDDRGTRKIFRRRLLGGIRSLEVKRGQGSGKWHAHYHCLVLTPSEWEKDYPWVQQKWKEVTGGEGSVDVRGIRHDKGVIKAAVETVKYICKPGEIETAIDFKTVYRALKGKRQVNTWGILRGLAKKIEGEMDASWDEKKLTDFVCRKCGCKEGIIIKLLEELQKVA